MKGNDMRLDPLRQTWTVFCPDRAVKPLTSGRAARAPLKKVSPFAPGNEQLTPTPLLVTGEAQKWRVRAFPNRAPAFRVEGDTVFCGDGLYDRTEAVGAHEVIVESPDAAPFDALALPAITEALSAWRMRIVDLMRDARLRSFQIVKNAGPLAGSQWPQAISQVIATAVLPRQLKQKLGVAREFYARKKRSIFEEILREEIRVGKRLVYENTGFAVFCPYASRAPFEVAVYPKRQLADFHRVSNEELAQLADVLKSALGKMSRALDKPSYVLALCTAPTRTSRRDYWHTLDADFRWHIEIVPRLFPSDGFEQATGWHINTVTPEAAAEFLRKMEM